MSAEELLYCAACMFSGTALQVREHQSRAHPADWANTNPDPGPDGVRITGAQTRTTESTSARLRQVQQDLAASQADLTATRGRVVDLLYIIDAFQIESGADREASYGTGIEAVRQLRENAERVARERDGVREELARQADENEDLRVNLGVRTGELAEMREARDTARAQIRALAGQRDLVLAELRALADANRRDACGLTQPYCFGPTRAAEAYEQAAGIVARKLGGGS